MGIRGLPSRLREEVRIFMGREGNPSEVEETKSRSSQQTVQATEESGIRSVMGERRGRGPESHAPRGIGQTLQGSFERLYRSRSLQIVNTKYSCESSHRDLHNTLLCTAWNPESKRAWKKEHWPKKP